MAWDCYATFLSFLLVTLMTSASATPVVQHQYCPVVKESGDFQSGLPPGSKVINMDAMEGHKVRLQFAYPNENYARKLSQDFSAETTTMVETEGVDATTTPIPGLSKADIYCQWHFRTTNESQFLLLTFDKLSAPYSKDCTDAFVAMQKYNAFESRWCGGNKKQTNKSRPMTLFSRGSAKVSVYRKGNAAMLPPTGFTVLVETVDASRVEGGKNALRVLLG